MKFIDDSESDDDTITHAEIQIREHKRKINCKLLTANMIQLTLYDFFMLGLYKHNFESYKIVFKSKQFSLQFLLSNNDWYPFFNSILQTEFYKQIINYFNLNCTKFIITPPPELLLSNFNYISPHNIKVIFLLGDIDAGSSIINNNIQYNSMGYGSSSPYNNKISKFTQYLFYNMLYHNTITEIPKSGNLSILMSYGCFLLNNSLTAILNQPKSHKILWDPFIKSFLNYINNNFSNIIFVVLGIENHMRALNIDIYKHTVLTANLPNLNNNFSGYTYGYFNKLSERKKINYPSLYNYNIWNDINLHLQKYNNPPIFWDSLNF